MKENKHISLEKAGNKLPFTVPENYFNDFAIQFDSQIGNGKRNIIHIIRPWLSVAAVFIGILIVTRVGYTAYQQKQANTENYELYVLSQVDETEMIDYYLTEADNDSNSK